MLPVTLIGFSWVLGVFFDLQDTLQKLSAHLNIVMMGICKSGFRNSGSFWKRSELNALGFNA